MEPQIDEIDKNLTHSLSWIGKEQFKDGVNL
jgi:hypothetical protein